MTGDKRGNEFIHIKSQLEQFETILEDFAPIVGTYFQALVASEVPQDLARDLILDWHNTYWLNALNLNRKD